MQLILVRHAQTGSLYKGKYLGSSDVPISDEGAKDVVRLADRLRIFSPAECICSPMKRTRQTAEYICDYETCSTSDL